MQWVHNAATRAGSDKSWSPGESRTRTARAVIHRLGGVVLRATAAILPLTAWTSSTISAPNTVAVLSQPISPIKFQVDKLDNQIGDLLLALPLESRNVISAEEMEETYRLIIRHLYQSAQRAANPTLRSRILLKADQLDAGLSDFDQWITALLSRSNVKNVVVQQACRKFYQASSQVNDPITSISNLNGYLHKILKPLAPLAQLELDKSSPLVVWPVVPPHRKQRTISPPTSAVPDINSEISALQQANILPQMRQIFRLILQQLQKGLNHPATRRQSATYYLVILQCVNLAEHLQLSTVLPQAARDEFNHRLMLGLLFFKDPRTRAAAARKLRFIAMIVHSMELLKAAPLPVRMQQIMTLRMHNTVAKLQRSDNGEKYAQQLRDIDALLTQQLSFMNLIARPHVDYLNIAWQRIRQDERNDFQQTVLILKHGFDYNAIHTYLTRVAELTVSLNRLLAMPGAAEQALLYHPEPAGGVQRNLARWVRHIGLHPYQTGHAVKSFDRFNKVLSLLAATHREMLAHGPEKTLTRLSGGRYDLFVAQFLQTQRHLVNALAHSRLAPNKLITLLNQQRLIFKTSSQLAYLMQKEAPLRRLNQWAAWHTHKGVSRLMLQQFEATLAAKFRTATTAVQVTSNAHHRKSAVWSDFHKVAPAIAVLANACENLLPQLHAPPTAWSTAWLQAYSSPPGNAFYRHDLSTFSQACMFFNDAEFN
ncbi:MAG: hypothetical protein ACP5VQ_02675, partial [Phycisphaerae bacterium]